MLISRIDASLQSTLQKNSGLTVVCYCAEWCNTCKTYQHDFETLSHQYPRHLFLWVDIEDNPELLDDIDVENFPSILIQQKDKNYFFGPILPMISHLDRLIQSIQEDQAQQRLKPITEGPPALETLF